MGIPRLASRLSAYSRPVVLNEATSSRIAVVDGPGLVHHVYYRLCDKLKGPVGYDDCAKATIAWLDTLKSFGFAIEAIFFDGALPPSKKDIRIERLQAYIARLQAFKQNSSASLSSMSPELRKSMPPPPFIVFAVVEELLRSEYNACVHLVPGEADPYCVAAANLSSALIKDDTIITVFSDDSDLLVYNHRENVRIITFRDLNEHINAGKPSWSGSEYWPFQIAAKASKPTGDLIRPAYIMSKDLYTSLEKTFHKIDSAGPAEDSEFDTFAETFSIAAETANWKRIKESPEMESDLASRDSRVSELIWQLQSLSNGVEPGGLRMYLPFLTDDISRSTAWNVATDIRQLAYSVLLRSFKCDTSIQEYRRSGTRVASVLVDRLSDGEIFTEAGALSKHITDLLDWVRDSTQLEEHQAWTYLAIQHVLRYCVSDNQSLPSLDDTLRAIMGRKERKWHLLHLNSQFQAAFYSFRILRQILAYTLAQKSEVSAEGPFVALSAQLNSLPRITIFFAERKTDNRKEEDDVWKGVLGDLLAILTKSTEAEVEVKSQEKEARPRKKAKKSKKSAPKSSGLAENPFAMLSEDS